MEYTIEFRHVTFRCPGQDVPVLDDLSFRLEHGRHTSLVGLNGAGKSTVVKLICRLYEPGEGEILLNGVNIHNDNKKDYHKHVAPVFQDSKMYAFSVRDNIALDEDCDLNCMWRILEELDMADRIKVLPHEEDTQVSGGEKQRLFIARAMYKQGGRHCLFRIG